MTEAALREKVVAQARSWLGRNEADGSHKEIIDIYNTIRPLPRGYKLTYKDKWCAGNVSAVAQACELTEIIFPECSCSRMIALFQKAGRWMENDAYVPSPADILFYGWADSGKGDYTGAPDHVGIVESCDGKTITVIEGNYCDSVKRREIAVNARYIRGFGLPDYAGMAASLGFPDVDPDAYFADAVDCVSANGIMQGFPDGTFHPEEPVNRGQLAVVVQRLIQKFGID